MALFTALFAAGVLAQSDPLDVKFVTSDIPLFWKAYDASKVGDPEAAFRDLYFGQGSDGLKAFVQARLKDPKTYAQSVGQMRPFYDSLPRGAEAVERQIPRMRAALLAFKNLYPEAKFPTVYFLVGRCATGGTSSRTGLLIGSEMYARTSETDMSGMTDWAKRVIVGPDILPAIVAHELVHYNQKGLPIGTLFARSLQEGSADFIGELASGQNINAKVHAWAKPREAELWKEFQTEMNGLDTKKWLYNDLPDRPADVGYFIGYRICEAFYNKAKDKRAAIAQILGGNYKRLLEESGYRGSPFIISTKITTVLSTNPFAYSLSGPFFSSSPAEAITLPNRSSP